MKIKELQQQLNKLDPELEIVCYTEDADLTDKNRLFRIMEITSVNAEECERTRLEDGTPYLKLGKSSMSTKIAFIDVTLDF